MNGTDGGEGLAREILAGARGRAEAILAAARTEAGRRLDAAREEAAAALERDLAEAGRRGEAERGRILAGLTSELQRLELKKTTKLLDGILAAARARLVAVESPLPLDALVAALGRGLAALGPDAVRLELSAALTESEAAELVARAGFAGEVIRGASLGRSSAVLFAADDRVRYEIGPDDIFGEGRQELYRVARAVLFGGDT